MRLLLLAALLAADDFDLGRLKPFWTSTTQDGESVLFVKESDVARAPLLFTPTRVISVRGTMDFQEGRDWAWAPGSGELTLPAGSRIPSCTPAELRRPAGSQKFRLTHRDGGGEILFGPGHEYHDLQVEVTYEHAGDAWKGPVPAFAGERLPRTTARLAERKPLTIALLGDSISTGCNASGWAKTAPFQPPWQELLLRKLEASTGAKVTLKNHAVGGTNSAWGLKNIAKVVESSPDLVILAFGMNDSGGVAPDAYRANLQGMIEAVRKAQPDAEFILVATMLANPDWTALRHERFPQYRDALVSLRSPGVELADLTSVWAEFQRRKRDLDLTGNGVNHPNDFGHRVYAQVLSSLLLRPEAFK
ncbi:MAG: SGNH/GDSL hydrolase family protein [Planctomycetes bacterium]|nr:SGNH/GDSL hydrolase family protein [Planctomycetota bacterium]